MVNVPFPAMSERWKHLSMITGWWLVAGAEWLSKRDVELTVAYRDSFY